MFAYFDETGRNASGFNAVAGYLFDDAGKDRFVHQYRERLEPKLPKNKRGIPIFHTAHCYDGEDPYFGTQYTIRDHFLSLMAGIIGETALMGVMIGVEAAEYQAGISTRIFRVEQNGQAAKSLASWVGSPYGLCLFRSVQCINDWMNQRKLTDLVHYVMEAGRPREEADALKVFSRIERSDPIRSRYKLASYKFEPKGPETPWLFAADYLAWWWQRNHHIKSTDNDDTARWQPAVEALIEAVPHIALYQTEFSIGIQGMVNFSYDLRGTVRSSGA